MEKKTQFTIWYAIIALLGVIWLRDLWVTSTQVETIPYSEFQRHLKELGGSGALLDEHRHFVASAGTPARISRRREGAVAYCSMRRSRSSALNWFTEVTPSKHDSS